MKRLTVLLLMVFCATGLSAQNLEVGGSIGFNSANVNFDGDLEPDSRTGIRAGGFVAIGLSEAFSVQPELLYSSKGYEVSVLGTTATAKLNYLSLPILAKYKIIEKSGFQAYALAGPYVSFLISANDGDGNDISDNVTSLDIGAQGGLGFGYKAGPGEVILNVRAGFGFSDINDADESGQNTSSAGSGTNQVLPSLTVGYAYPL